MWDHVTLVSHTYKVLAQNVWADATTQSKTGRAETHTHTHTN